MFPLRLTSLPFASNLFRTMSSSRPATTSSYWSRLVRFQPRSAPTTILVGEPVDTELDVGLATYAGKEVMVDVFSGTSVLQPGERTGRQEAVERLLSPVSKQEVGTIRCIGLNVSPSSLLQSLVVLRRSPSQRD